MQILSFKDLWEKDKASLPAVFRCFDPPRPVKQVSFSFSGCRMEARKHWCQEHLWSVSNLGTSRNENNESALHSFAQLELGLTGWRKWHLERSLQQSYIQRRWRNTSQIQSSAWQATGWPWQIAFFIFFWIVLANIFEKGDAKLCYLRSNWA